MRIPKACRDFGFDDAFGGAGSKLRLIALFQVCAAPISSCRSREHSGRNSRQVSVLNRDEKPALRARAADVCRDRLIAIWERRHHHVDLELAGVHDSHVLHGGRYAAYPHV